MSVLTTRKPPLTKALYFDGISSYVSIPDSPSLRVNDFTIEIMSKRLTVVPQHYEFIIFKTSDVWHGSISITDESSQNTIFRIEAPQGNHNIIIVGNFWTVDQWVYGSFVRKANEAWVYKNGVQVGYTNSWSTSNIYYTSDSWQIPKHLGGIQRYIAFIRIYSRALSRSEILHNYRNPNNPIRDGLVLWLDARNVIGNTWYDLSGYGNNGTIYGATQVSLFNPPGGW